MRRRLSRREPIAQHGRLRSPGVLSQLLTFVGVSVAVVAVSAIAVVGYSAYSLTSSFAANQFTLEGETALPPDIGSIEGGLDLLLVGSDECDPSFSAMFGDRCDGPDAEGARNDVTILVHISDSPRRITVISFPRDLEIPIPACTDQTTGQPISAMSKQMLNSTLDPGGVSCVAKTITQLSGQKIDMAAKVTWGGVINITDAIGGIDVCVQNGIDDPDAGLHLPAGVTTVQGAEALAFLRSRHGVGNGGDLARISNQQQYFSALARKITSPEVLSDMPTLYRLATTAVQNISPSANLANPLTLIQIALAAKSVPADQIVFLQYPTKTDPDDPNRVVPDETAASALWTALANNTALQISGGVSPAGGVEQVSPTGAPIPLPSTSATPSPDPSASATPGADTSVLPSAITGTNASQRTCSNGNG
ncbi:LCP family protein [Microbacterium sp. SORGH_AS_0888]|uniref:LCP family protein n=1 Tax=Microbacterium sp. SORGH_AS_0888 TaxID=3041791 RepID=UPI00278B0EA5|nr:LCP family protein [Microbacterium sp. SORGH_AS_0888]MDQ1128660.1 LCP family protein required for cell wall assembly [Microbacterium sp. SORGH_AS_0888]